MPLGWFYVFGVCGGVACFVGCWGIGVTCFDTLYCLIDAWCLVIWLNVELLVINYLLRTCILFTHTCTITTIDCLTWGVVFWFSLLMIAVPNLGCVGYVVKACIVLWLHRLSLNAYWVMGILVALVGLWHNFCILSWFVQLKECKIEGRTHSSFKKIVEVVQICLICLLYSQLSELVFFNLDDFCRALACWSTWLILSEIKCLLFQLLLDIFIILWARVICLKLSCSETSSCNLVRVNSTPSVLLYCLVFVKFCGILNSSWPCA